jgi:hypothetical protein
MAPCRGPSATCTSDSGSIEGKYVIATSEMSLSVVEVASIYEELSDVEKGFRHLKDVLAVQPIYLQVELRVKAHIFVAALTLMVQRLLHRRPEQAGTDFSPRRAMQALSAVRLVTFELRIRQSGAGSVVGAPTRCGY